MKTSLASILMLFLLTSTDCLAQKTITVEAQSNDISNNLDLQAVASVFGDSRDLQDFEMRLNSYDNQISNLDLNNDGEVDYLRVIEDVENNVHVVIIQSVLDKDVFQDVATIVVEKRENRRTIVQVIGDPFIYGNNYIIEPVYVYKPSIFSFFWGCNYQRWYSPYYYGYYPHNYRHRHPFNANFYQSHINTHINHNHHYFYTDRRRNESVLRLHHSLSKNDYGNRYPERSFNRRNENVRYKQEFHSNKNAGKRNIQTYPTELGNQPENRQYKGIENNDFRNERYQNRTRILNPTINTQQNVENRNSRLNERNSNTYTSSTNTNRETHQTRSYNNSESRMPNTVIRDNNSRNIPAINQSSRRNQSGVIENSQGKESKSEKGSGSSITNSNRR